MRYVLEGEWTGYRSAQQRVVHREIVSEKRAERLRAIHKIVYTDGTALLLRVREAKYRERVEIMRSYCDLIAEAEKRGSPVLRVADLYPPKNVGEAVENIRSDLREIMNGGGQ